MMLPSLLNTIYCFLNFHHTQTKYGRALWLFSAAEGGTLCYVINFFFIRLKSGSRSTISPGCPSVSSGVHHHFRYLLFLVMYHLQSKRRTDTQRGCSISHRTSSKIYLFHSLRIFSLKILLNSVCAFSFLLKIFSVYFKST